MWQNIGFRILGRTRSYIHTGIPGANQVVKLLELLPVGGAHSAVNETENMKLLNVHIGELMLVCGIKYIYNILLPAVWSTGPEERRHM